MNNILIEFFKFKNVKLYTNYLFTLDREFLLYHYNDTLTDFFNESTFKSDLVLISDLVTNFNIYILDKDVNYV